MKSYILQKLILEHRLQLVSSIESLTDKLEASRFTKNAKKFLISCAEYLFEHLPLDEQTLLDVRALHPANQVSMGKTATTLSYLNISDYMKFDKKYQTSYSHCFLSRFA